MNTTLEAWIENARPNESFCYHTGWNLSLPAADQDTLYAVRGMYNRGLVDLVQRRASHTGQNRFEYLAVKRANPKRPDRPFLLAPLELLAA